MINWLENNKWINILLILIYYLLVVLPHKSFGSFLNRVIFKGITRDQYNLYVIIGFSVVLAVFGYIFMKNTWKLAERNRLIFYALCTCIFAVLIINILFVINIEVVHFPQYAFFAILIFPLIKNYNSTLIWATIGGALDEAYQYFYLAPNDTGYYDFNDIVTNLVGAAFGLLFLSSFLIRNNPKSFFKSSGFYAILGITTIVGFLFFTNVLSIQPDPESQFPIIKKSISKFWHKVPPNVTFHVMKPWEGLITCGVLLLFYSKIVD